MLHLVASWACCAPYATCRVRDAPRETVYAPNNALPYTANCGMTSATKQSSSDVSIARNSTRYLRGGQAILSVQMCGIAATYRDVAG